MFKFTFTVVFNYLRVNDAYMGYLWTGKIVLGLGLKGLSSFDITAGNEGEPSDALTDFYRAMHFSAKRGIAIACRLSVRLSVCL